jgi:hypothetical protein
MKLSDFKQQLNTTQELDFVLPDGKPVSRHFHVTEVGQVTKHFIDCGGTMRNEKVVNFQLWEANDTDHRLAPQKLMSIISLSEKVLGIEDAEIEVEYQSDTIGKYGVEFNGSHFILTTKYTNCLASDNCGVPKEKQKVKLTELNANKQGCCAPGAGCC